MHVLALNTHPIPLEDEVYLVPRWSTATSFPTRQSAKRSASARHPISRPFRLPQDCTAVLIEGADYTMKNVAPKLAFRDGFDHIARKLGA